MRWLLLAVVVTAALLAPAGPARGALLCRTPVARAVWTQEPQGARIHVFPTGCGRSTAWASTRSAFRAALAAGGREGGDVVHRRSLLDQFRCHAVFAPYKRSWNLETWRPVVGAKRMVRSLCNPTGRPGRPSGPAGRTAGRRRGLFATVLAVVIRRG